MPRWCCCPHSGCAADCGAAALDRQRVHLLLWLCRYDKYLNCRQPVGFLCRCHHYICHYIEAFALLSFYVEATALVFASPKRQGVFGTWHCLMALALCGCLYSWPLSPSCGRSSHSVAEEQGFTAVLVCVAACWTVCCVLQAGMLGIGHGSRSIASGTDNVLDTSLSFDSAGLHPLSVLRGGCQHGQGRVQRVLLGCVVVAE